MHLGIRVSPSRCVAVWAGATAGAAVLLALLVPVAVAGPGGSGFESALVWSCAAAACATTCWLWVVATVVSVDALRGLATARRGVPAGVRCALLVLGGAAIAGGLASPALAGGQGPAGPQVLAGLRLPERVAVGPAIVTPIATPLVTPAAPSATSPALSAVEVAPGDTLWDIAAQRLGAATSWPAIYALNRDLIGPDPGVITPGQRLVLPTGSGGGAR
jgi:LysM repeat protein